MQRPLEQEIVEVMEEYGMDYIQARNHLLGRFELQKRMERKSSYRPVKMKRYDDELES